MGKIHDALQRAEEQRAKTAATLAEQRRQAAEYRKEAERQRAAEREADEKRRRDELLRSFELDGEIAE